MVSKASRRRRSEEFQHEVTVDEGLGLGIHRHCAETVDRHEKIRPLDVGAVHRRHGQRRLVQKEISKPGAIEPNLQGALPALPLFYPLQRRQDLRPPSAAA